MWHFGIWFSRHGGVGVTGRLDDLKGQEELEAIIQQDGYDLVAITETWWDNSHDWHAVIDGYGLFRKDRPARRGGGVALYVREQVE